MEIRVFFVRRSILRALNLFQNDGAYPRERPPLDPRRLSEYAIVRAGVVGRAALTIVRFDLCVRLSCLDLLDRLFEGLLLSRSEDRFQGYRFVCVGRKVRAGVLLVRQPDFLRLVL